MNFLLSFFMVATMMNARIRFEDSQELRQSGRSICFATKIVQTSGDYLVIEPGELCGFQPANDRGCIFAPEGSISGCALTHMKELAWEFSLVEGGEYEVWMRALFPLPACYNHGELMDDGERIAFYDSVDSNKINKFAPLPGYEQMADKWLEPNIWHWYLNTRYMLSAGNHRYWFPPNGAWCGGCILDRIVLIKKGSKVKAENAAKDNRKVIRPSFGVITSRRIKTERIAKWLLEADVDAGGGSVNFEYSYGGEKWLQYTPGKIITVTDNSEYLYIRIKMAAAEKGFQPVVKNYRFRVEKKEKNK